MYSRNVKVYGWLWAMYQLSDHLVLLELLIRSTLMAKKDEKDDISWKSHNLQKIGTCQQHSFVWKFYEFQVPNKCNTWCLCQWIVEINKAPNPFK